jgi:hypothetical protein
VYRQCRRGNLGMRSQYATNRQRLLGMIHQYYRFYSRDSCILFAKDIRPCAGRCRSPLCVPELLAKRFCTKGAVSSVRWKHFPIAKAKCFVLRCERIPIGKVKCSVRLKICISSHGSAGRGNRRMRLGRFNGGVRVGIRLTCTVCYGRFCTPH